MIVQLFSSLYPMIQPAPTTSRAAADITCEAFIRLTTGVEDEVDVVERWEVVLVAFELEGEYIRAAAKSQYALTNDDALLFT